MARIRINVPDTFLFRTGMSIRIPQAFLEKIERGEPGPQES